MSRDHPYMFADDLFWKGCIQVFSTNTGNFHHFIRPWEDVPEEVPGYEEEEPEPEEVKDEMQLELFE
jgi:hypothetical protein